MPGVPCARHPQIETRLTCQRCETPICPQCMIATPVGMKCRDCVSHAGAGYMQSAPQELVFAFLGGVVIASVMSWVLLMCLIAGAPYGYAIGEAVLRCGKRKRGVATQVVAALCVVIGAGVALSFPFRTAVPLFLFNVVLAVIVAVSRVRHF